MKYFIVAIEKRNNKLFTQMGSFAYRILDGRLSRENAIFQAKNILKKEENAAAIIIKKTNNFSDFLLYLKNIENSDYSISQKSNGFYFINKGVNEQ
jgi:hypothetical protein